MSTTQTKGAGVHVDMLGLRTALEGLTARDPGDFVQAGILQVVANLGLCPAPQPAPLTLPQVREIGGYFQEALHRCAILRMVLAGKMAIAPDEQGNLTAIPLTVPTPDDETTEAPAASVPAPAAPVPGVPNLQPSME